MPHYSLLPHELHLTFDCTLVFFIIIVTVAIRLDHVCSHSIKTPFNIGGCGIMAGAGSLRRVGVR